MRILSSAALLLALAACGAPTSEANRPKADEGTCGRIDGQTRCSDNLTTSRNPAEKSAF